MKTKIGSSLTLMLIVAVLLISCASVGQYMPISSQESVIGTIQATFVARDSWFSKDEILNTQAYIKLLEAAVQKYPGDIDIRDIVWVTGRTLGSGKIEVSAIGKIIEVNPDGK